MGVGVHGRLSPRRIKLRRRLQQQHRKDRRGDVEGLARSQVWYYRTTADAKADRWFLFPAAETRVESPKKDGRGRPRKIPTAVEDVVMVPKKEGRGRGRPRKMPLIVEDVVMVPKKAGRGRPRKSLPAEEPADTAETTLEPATHSESTDDAGRSYWLMKAEPESRIEKGVDVKFSIDDLAAAEEPEPWDGMCGLLMNEEARF